VCLVAVGYIYKECVSRPYWEVQSAMIAGCDMMSSEIGGWNVDVHHVYSRQEGILTSLLLYGRPNRAEGKPSDM